MTDKVELCSAADVAEGAALKVETHGLALAVFPVMYFIHRSYKLYFNRIAESLRPAVQARAASASA